MIGLGKWMESDGIRDENWGERFSRWRGDSFCDLIDFIWMLLYNRSLTCPFFQWA